MKDIELNKLYFFCSLNKDYIPCIIRKFKSDKWYVEIYRSDIKSTYITKINKLQFNIMRLISISDPKVITKIRLKGLIE